MNSKLFKTLNLLAFSTAFLAASGLSFIVPQLVQSQPKTTPTPTAPVTLPPPQTTPAIAPAVQSTQSSPPPVTQQTGETYYNPPKSYNTATSTQSLPPPPRIIPHDVVGCDDKGHSNLVRQIRLGEVVHCVLGEDSFRKDGRPIHMYEFQGAAEQALDIKLIGGKAGDWQLNPYLVLLGPDRRVVSADDNTSKQRIAELHVKLPANGIYTILASNHEAKEFGRYSVVVERDPNRYSLDESSELTDRSQRMTQNNSTFNLSEFKGEQGQQVTIRASSYSFFPVLILLDSDGQEITRKDNIDGNRNVTLEYRLPKSGTYKVIVNSLRPEDKGSYRLTISSSAQGR